MKKLFILLFTSTFSIIYSQQQTFIQNENFEDRWDKYTNPNTDNYFYYHFKKYISNDLISKKDFPNKTSKIIIEFNLDSIYNVENLRVNTKNILLEEAILKAFQEIDFTKISIQVASKLHNYSLQILALENGVAVLKCSSNVLNEVPPIMEGCEQKLNYEDYDKCFKSNLSYYIENAFDTTYISEKDTKIYPKVSFDKNGKLHLIDIHSNDPMLVEGTKKSVQNFNQRFRPATLNGVTDSYEVDLIIDSDDLGKSNKWCVFENASTENELANYFKNQIPIDLLKQEQLNLKHNNITLTYTYNKQNSIENVKTTATNKNLNEALINSFNNFPSEKLVVSRKNLLDSYIVQVMNYENNENIIKCSNPIIYESLPVFNGCEKSKTYTELLNCNQETLQNHVKSIFDTNLARGLEPGIKKIYVIFTIGKKGDVENVQARAPSKALENEAIRVVEKFDIQNPGYQMGKPVKVKYSLPIAFKVEGSNKNTKSQPENMINRNPYQN